MKTVLLFRSSFCRSNRLEYDGVFDYARTRQWRIQTIEYMSAATNRYRLQGDDSIPTISSLLDFWKPAGCIVECRIAPHTLMKRDFGKVPVVFLDRDPETVESDAVCIHSDSHAIAANAARELLLLGIDDFAFIGWPEPVHWSETRGKRFREIILNHGKRIAIFRPKKSIAKASDLKELENFLRSLPRPCGLFAANDVLAKQVVSACTHCKIAIPDQLAIVSVDNDEDICEHSPVTITSIDLDWIGAGTKAAEMLDLIMSSKSRKTKTSPFGVSRLVRRQSAIGFRHLDKRMNDALEFIRVHACEKISVSDVVRVMNCSRRLATMRFRATLNRSILDEIHRNRINAAKIQMERHQPLDRVAAECGYSSNDDFRRVFKRYTGLSPRNWKDSLSSTSRQ